MKVLHINDKIENSGGVEVYIHQLLELSPEYGLDADLLAIKREEGKLQGLTQGGAVVTEIEHDDLAEFVSQYDILHLHSISDPDLIKYLSKLKPLIRSMHEPRMICPGSGKFLRKSEKVCQKPFGLHCFYQAYKEGCCNRHPKRLIPAYQNTAFEVKYAHQVYRKVLVMSEYMREEAIKAGIPKDVLNLNPYFSSTKIESKKKTMNNGTKKLLFVGRLIRHKGVHYAINAVEKLLRQGVDVYLDIIGEGVDKDEFKCLVHDLGVGQFVNFSGWKTQKDVLAAMLQADIVLVPSIYPEAFGIVGLEAMAKGQPVVGFDVGGISQWLTPKVGALVKGISNDDFAEGIISVLNDTTQYDGQSEFRKKYMPVYHIEALKKMYKDCI
ncbi:hypothetical protein FUAX_24880 [Fulvitalea axinellae]|uniref:Glycosyl transferase family 1 domain-containing protein n=1 Tax=Fulvitalea axinellae TaxID=1182444 RepID=A0AAU9CD56_9BACT|nr:hypothetical protein FUAX_24880 [Fulvitalea axinellae]